MPKRERESDEAEVATGGRLPKHLQRKLRKERKRELTGEGGGGVRSSEEAEYPYFVNDDDHCETPLAAYRDIAPILDAILKEKKGVGAVRSELAIYDPYFCEGSMKEHLASLDFTNVYNKREDFYKVIEQQTLPEFDVLVTNPPYSGDHPMALLKFIKQQSEKKPFLLLMPNWVYTKDYYSILPADTLFYVSPHARYLYTTPKGRRQKKSGKVTSPFPSIWYCGTGISENAKESSTFIDGLEKTLDPKNVHLSRTTSQLSLAVAHETDPRKKKARDRMKRAKNKKKKKRNVINS